ncbi:hypothetical protein PDESU_04238 [Pontiella desulfatans]|uniref:PEP-CTERM protein-sorting domain-containing protein n=1 Tax=Pontiella desulfatans TaxID=2750659 RepID=A0A6C2U6X4_PONDE|nr:PEP-CTERM sorting domain-containing protein [Pontiella desulfatans]VGO15653.1 hypothetical protein PDESU_04238 [Pontiella desulfatans]
MRKQIVLVASLLAGGLLAQAQTQTWDPDGNSISDGGAGTWDLATGNWMTGATWVNGSDAFFGTGSYNVTLGTGVVVHDLSIAEGAGTVNIQSAVDDTALTVAGSSTWNLGGNTLHMVNTTPDTRLSMTSGETLTVTGGGTFNTGERPNDGTTGLWDVNGATLDFQADVLIGNQRSIGEFALVKLGANSTFINQRNAHQTFNNNWEFGGGTITFQNNWANNGNITVNGTVSGYADEFVIDMATPTSGNRLVYLNNSAAYTAGTNRIAEAVVQLNADHGLSSSVLVLGGVSGKNSYLNMNGHDQSTRGISNDIGNTREIRNNAAVTTSTLTVDVEAGNSFTYSANFNGAGVINLVKTGDGTQVIQRASGHTSALDTLSVEGGELVWNVGGSGNSGTVNVGINGTLSGSGILNGATTVAGNLMPGNSPGTLTLNDALTLESTATLTLEITGTDAGLYDVLLNDGGDTLTAGGTLVLDTTGYTAALNDTFTVFENWGGFSGGFDGISGTDLGGGMSFDTSNLLVDGTLTVVPEPGTLGMLVAMGGGLIWIRRVFMV